MSPTMERRLSGVYRRVFVDLREVAKAILPHIPANARILDIGGGDGELLNHLLKARPDLSIDMVDIAPAVGKFIQPEYETKVKRYTGTPVENLPPGNSGYDVVLVSDVMHHLPVDYRGSFLRSIHDRLGENGCILIKDIEPGHPIASLSLFCDMHISGDKGVSLVSISDLKTLCNPLGPTLMAEIGLLDTDRPNYALKVSFGSPKP